MAISNLADNGATRRLVILCVSLSAAINTPVFYILKEHASEMAEIRTTITAKTADRYYRRDAENHEKVETVRYSGIIFRFERNEQNIAYCMNEIEKLKAQR